MPTKKLGRTKCQPQKKVRTKCQPLVGIMSGWHFVRLAFCPHTGASLESVCSTRMVYPGESGINGMQLFSVRSNVDSVGIKNPPSFLRLFIAYNLSTGNPRVDSWIVKTQQFFSLCNWELAEGVKEPLLALSLVNLFQNKNGLLTH